MSFSLTVGRFFGTAVRLHVTFVLFLLLIAGVSFVQGGAGAAAATLALIVLLFGCVVLHEFGHVLAARRYGVHTPDIVLLPIGGVARMAQMPETPRQEIIVALAGPAVNVVIAGVLFVGMGGFPTGMQTWQPTLGALAAQLFYANVLLVVFNMIPAFPMDGGRVVRALLAMWKGHALATRIAARLGQVLAIMFGLVGLATGNLILALVGAFIFFAASAEGRAAGMIQAARGMRNSDAMIDRFARLGRDSRLADAIDCRLRTGQQVVPVCDSDGRLVGMLTRQGMFDQLKKNGSEAPVVELMMTDLPSVHVSDALEASVRSLQQGSAAAIGVVDDAERLVGLVTRETIDDLLMLDRADRDRPGRRRSVIANDISI